MRNLLLLFTSCILFPDSYGQSIKGLVLDSLRVPVAYCTIGLLNAKDSAVVKGTLTDDKGNFIFESLPRGKYILKINHVGYRESFFPVIEYDSLSNMELQPLILNSGAVNLNEVGIVTIKDPIQFKNGNITVNIDGSPLAIGNSVYDLLARLPGVAVDRDQITIQGRPGVRLYLDDRQQQLSGTQLINFLKSMSASTVENIEIINNPSSKYDAAGGGGILNIKTKKIKIVGFSGSTNLTYSQGFYENTNGAFSLNYKGKKVTFFSTFNASQAITHNVSTFNKAVSYTAQTTYLDQSLTDNYNNKNIVVDVGADWYLDKNNIVGAKIRTLSGYAINLEKATTSISDNSLGYDQLVLEKSLPNDWLMINYNLNAEHLFDTLGTKLKFSVDYYDPNYDNFKGVYSNYFLDKNADPALPSKTFLSNNKLTHQIFIPKLDFERKISKTLSFESGLKYTLQNLTSDYLLEKKDNLTGEYSTDTALTNIFTYKERVTAGYITLNKELKKLNIQLGLRGENTVVYTETANNSVSYNRNYFNLFPTLGVDYNHSKDHVFSLNYNKRIGRPDPGSLNPYRSFVDILNYYQGNPYVRQAYAHNFSFNYALKSSIYNSLTYSRYRYAISGYTSQNDSTKESTMHITNLDYYQILRYSFFTRQNIKKWWVVSFNFGTYYIGYSGKLNGQNYSLSAIPYYAWMNNLFMLPKDVKIEITGYYWSPWVGIASRYKARGAMSLAVKKSFLKNALTCSIAVNDIFFSEVFRSYADFQNQKWQRYEKSDTRRLNISLSYNFGRIKVEKRDTGSEPENKINKK